MADLALLFGRGEHAPYRGSVLPRIASTRTAEGTRLTVGGAGAKEIRQISVYSVCIAAAAVMVIFGRGSWSHMMRVFSFILGTGGMLAGGIHQYRTWRRLRRATLMVRSWPIKFGTPVETRFRIFMRGGAPVTALAAKLECIEEVTIGIGRDAEHRRSARYSAALAADGDHETDRRHVTAAWSFVIPEEHPPSLAVPSNKVTWRLTATVTTGEIEIPVAFDLLVVPEVAG